MSRDIYDWLREYRSLKGDILYPFSKEKEEYELRKGEVAEKRKRFLEAKDKLDDITVRQLAQCKKNLMMSIEKALELTASNRLGYPLSRNQGLIIPNYVYGKVLGIIESAMNSAQGFSYPELYFDSTGDFDASQLRQVLTNFKNELEVFQPSSFFDLELLYEKYADTLKQLWQKENEAHPGGH